MKWRACLFAVSVPLVLFVAGSQPQARAATVSTCVESEFDAALANGGVVTFSCSGIVAFTSSKFILGDVVIDGSGAHVTFSGGGAVGLFRVQQGASLTLRNLTLSEGRQPGGGGAVHVHPGGQLAAHGVAFRSNRAPYGGAIANNGITRIVGSKFHDNVSDGAVATYSGSGGGAISNGLEAKLTVETSFFEGNSAPLMFQAEPNVRPSAGQGGAIQNRGVTTIVQSTFTGNSAFDGGAVYNAASPAFAGSGVLTVVNSTFAGDMATFGGEEIYTSGHTRMINSTLVGNTAPDGAAIAHYPFPSNPEYALHLTNTILAIRGCVSNADLIVDGGGNLATGSADYGCGLPIGADPNLGPLQDNGGGVPTMAIGTSSSAFERGVKAACGPDMPEGAGGVDQRGSPRFTCSSGAFEPRAAQASLNVRYIPGVARE